MNKPMTNDDHYERAWRRDEFDETVARLAFEIVGAISNVTKPDTMEIFAALISAFAYFASAHPVERRKEIIRQFGASLPTVEENIETCVQMNADRSESAEPAIVTTPSTFGH